MRGSKLATLGAFTILRSADRTRREALIDGIRTEALLRRSMRQIQKSKVLLESDPAPSPWWVPHAKRKND